MNNERVIINNKKWETKNRNRKIKIWYFLFESKKRKTTQIKVVEKFCKFFYNWQNKSEIENR